MFQKRWTIIGIQFGLCDNFSSCLRDTSPDSDVFSYFPSLHYCYLEHDKFFGYTKHTFVLDVINNCKELKCVTIDVLVVGVPLTSAQNHNLQQLYIRMDNYGDPFDDVPDVFMSSVSAHGGLVRVYLVVYSLTTEGITTLVRISPKLIEFYAKPRNLYDVNGQSLDQHDIQVFKATLKRMFTNRKLFNVGYYEVDTGGWQVPLPEDLSPLWNVMHV